MLRPRVVLACPALLVCACLVGACGGSKAEAPVVSPVQPTATATPEAPASGDTTTAPSAHVLQFDTPSEVACDGSDATIVVTYATIDLAAVGFVVDGTPVTGAAAPTSGTYEVALPCDGAVHTIQLIGSGPSGPAFASKAVVTRST